MKYLANIIRLADKAICPISLEVMEDPVVIAGTKHVFERAAIEDWWQNHTTNPLNNVELSEKQRVLIPMDDLRSEIALNRDALDEYINSDDYANSHEDLVAQAMQQTEGSASSANNLSDDFDSANASSPSSSSTSSPGPSVSAATIVSIAAIDYDLYSESEEDNAPEKPENEVKRKALTDSQMAQEFADNELADQAALLQQFSHLKVTDNNDAADAVRLSPNMQRKFAYDLNIFSRKEHTILPHGVEFKNIRIEADGQRLQLIDKRRPNYNPHAVNQLVGQLLAPHYDVSAQLHTLQKFISVTPKENRSLSSCDIYTIANVLEKNQLIPSARQLIDSYLQNAEAVDLPNDPAQMQRVRAPGVRQCLGQSIANMFPQAQAQSGLSQDEWLARNMPHIDYNEDNGMTIAIPDRAFAENVAASLLRAGHCIKLIDGHISNRYGEYHSLLHIPTDEGVRDLLQAFGYPAQPMLRNLKDAARRQQNPQQPRRHPSPRARLSAIGNTIRRKMGM